MSLEVPKTFSELLAVLKGFPVFAVCFFALIMVWWAHFRFFRTYGLQDTVTVLLNMALLFVVLFYVFPLKFLFGFLLSGMQTKVEIGGKLVDRVEVSQVPIMMTIYGAGILLVYLIIAMMFSHAYRLRSELDLNAVEIYVTKSNIVKNLLIVGISALSIVFALFGGEYASILSGFTYWLLPVVFTVHGSLSGKKTRELGAKAG